MLAFTVLTAGCDTAQDPLGPDEPAASDPGDRVTFVLRDPKISESSGLAASREHPGVYYTHNDMGRGPEVFAISSATGATEAVLSLDAVPVDWEDIGVTDSGVWVADIGGGDDGARETVSVLQFPEPRDLADRTVEVTEYQLTYEDGPHNAEALLVDPASEQVYVVTKDPQGGAIYAAPPRLTTGKNTLARVSAAPPNVTGGSWASEGPGFVLRNYPRAFIYRGLGQGAPTVVELPKTPQGESVVLLDDGDLLIGSEGEDSQVVRVDVPSPET